MIRVFRWDGKEMYINPDTMMRIEKDSNNNATDVTFIDGVKVSLSAPCYDFLALYIKGRSDDNRD